MKVVLALIISMALVCPFANAQSLNLKKSQIQKFAGIGTCGLVKNKWVPVSKKKGKYQKVAGSAELKSLCKSLLKKTKISLKSIPNSSDILKSSSADAQSFNSASISGVPPTLSEINTLGASNVFWAPGIIDAINSGSPSPAQCNELYGSSTDGSSAGFPGCYMAQETGFVMENIIQSGTTLCYMKNFPTQEVQDSGGFTVESGSLPGGDITKLFLPPTDGSPRYVKIHIGSPDEGEQEGGAIGLFKIYSQKQNEQSGDQYRYDLVFCEEGASSAQEFERTRISLAGELVTQSRKGYGGGSEKSVIRAYLTSQDGELIVNPDLGRLVEFTQVNGSEFYKSSLTLDGDNLIENKVFTNFMGSTRKGFSIAKFSGESAPSVRFLEGAYKELNSSFGSFSIATEYRDSYYASTENSIYSDRLSEVDTSSDSFFSSEPSIGDESAPLSCDQEASVELRINMESSSMQAVSELCEADRLDGMDFCRDDALNQAEENFQQVCTQN